MQSSLSLEGEWRSCEHSRPRFALYTKPHKEYLGLFRRCELLALPYMGATQSALIPAADFFCKPVIAAPSGALDEYVENDETGWMVEPEHPPSLARCLSSMRSDVDRLVRMGAAGRAWYDARRDAEEQELRRMYEYVAGGVG